VEATLHDFEHLHSSGFDEKEESGTQGSEGFAKPTEN